MVCWMDLLILCVHENECIITTVCLLRFCTGQTNLQGIYNVKTLCLVDV